MNGASMLAGLLLLASLAVAQSVPDCSGAPNTIPLYTADPTPIAEVQNGKLGIVGQGNDTVFILHLWGTPYQRGFAQGQLHAERFMLLQANYSDWLENKMIRELAENGHPVPSWLVDLFVTYGAPALLQWSLNNTLPYISQDYLDEMQGMADGAGIDVKIIQNFNMFPELTKAACTIVGAYGNSTPNHKISHLRGLDFSPNCPIKDYAQVTIYHSSTGGPNVANFGWMAMIGALTGISDTVIGIGEKVWDAAPKNADGLHGKPWMFILRDVLMNARNMDEALDMLQSANRTCAIHVGVGDSTTNTFRGVVMAKYAYQVYNWTMTWEGHPLLTDVFYWNKHVQPSHSPCLGNVLQANYGNLTAETLALTVAPTHQTGDMHAVTFDYENLIAFVANARKSYDPNGDLPAYNRQFIRLNLKKLFAVTQ